MKTTGNLILMTTICVVIFWVFMALRPANAQCTYRMNDVGRPHGYLSGPCNGAAVGYAGAYPSRATSQSNGNASGCDALCRQKCDATWRNSRFRNLGVGACYAHWAKLNRTGKAQECEAAYHVGQSHRAAACR
jgi:hypothetical protein